MKEFKPAFLFLAKFLGIYFLGNLAYGFYVESYNNKPDLITEIVSSHSAQLLNLNYEGIMSQVNPEAPTVFLKEHDQVILSVFEGCNGINVMIIFVAFIFAFGGPGNKMYWFIPAGILTIHLANLLRISLLFVVSKHYQQYFYYIHKYFFTAILYLIVLILWAIWVFKFNAIKKQS